MGEKACVRAGHRGKDTHAVRILLARSVVGYPPLPLEKDIALKGQEDIRNGNCPYNTCLRVQAYCRLTITGLCNGFLDAMSD